ncbi:Mediator of RNA polymerase II transcription subunit 5 [Spathaspora sp. JA1]|nr:Mediator of RNA polymerase II transcription subunit 5 [Spathaspora sp. JA1]
MAETISLSKLVTKATSQRLPCKSFISLINQLNNKQPIQDNQYVHELLELDNNTTTTLKQQRNNEYKIDLIVDLSFSSTEQSHQFWKNLGKLDNFIQVKYLIKISKMLLNYSKLDRDVIRHTINIEFIEYSLDYLNKLHDKTFTTSQKLVVKRIIFIVGSIIDNKLVKSEQESILPIQNFIIKLITILKNLKLTKLLSFLLFKAKTILTVDQIEHLAHSKIIRHDLQIHHTPKNDTSSSENSSVINYMSIATLGITTLSTEKQIEYYKTSRIFWLIKIMQNFEFENIATEFVNSYIQNQNSSPYTLAYEFISTFLNCIDLLKQQDFRRFNLQNFLITRVPSILLTNFKLLSEEDLTSVVDNVFTGDHIELKSKFNKSLSINKVLPNSTDDLVELNLRQRFNEKLLNINSEFTSLEESGLIEFMHGLPRDLEFSQKHQLELSSIIIEIINDLISGKDFEKLNRLLLCIMNNIDLLNLIMFNCQQAYGLLYQLIDFIDSTQFNIDEDDENFQDTFTYFGVTLLAIILIIDHFKLDYSYRIKNSFIIDYLNNFYYGLCENLTNQIPADEEENEQVLNYNNLISDWINGLFDDNNDGLSDELIKSVNIKQIYELIPIIYQQAIIATSLGKLSYSSLTNGLDYLSQVFLIPSTVSLISWLLKEVNLLNKLDSDNVHLKVLSEIIQSNTTSSSTSSSTSQDVPVLILNIIRNIHGRDIYKTITKFKEWETIPIAKDMISVIGNYDSDPIISKDLNVCETIKLQLINGNNTTTLPLDFIIEYIQYNKSQVIWFLIFEVYNFQKSNDEELKYFINLMVYLIVLYSPNKNLSSVVSFENGNTGITDKFGLNIDQHYSSSIFQTKPEIKPDDEDQDMLNDDLFNDISNTATTTTSSTSSKLLKLTQEIDFHRSLLGEFTKIKSDNHKLFEKSIKVLNDKILHELNKIA